MTFKKENVVILSRTAAMEWGHMLNLIRLSGTVGSITSVS